MFHKIKTRTTLLFLFVLIAYSTQARAGLVDLNLLYYSDSLNASSTASSSKLFYDLFVGFSLYKKNTIIAGWNYANYATSSTENSSTTTYSANQMGPKFIFLFGHEQNWRLGLGYNLIAKASYQNGSSPSETWKGSAFVVDAGYQFFISDNVLFGVRLNYSMSNYNEKLVGTDYSTDSSRETFIYPSLAVSYIW